MSSPEYPDLAFVRPRAYGSGRPYGPPRFIVVHYTAGSERATSAEDGAAYDQRRTDGVSTHYFVDQNSVVQCVLTSDRANAAYTYGNRWGIQYELCGTVQTRAQWLDAASDATITNAARQIARDCRRYGIPVRWLTPAEMKAGAKGIGGHDTVTLAYGLGDHMDPGAAFPRDILIERVARFVGGSSSDDDKAPTGEQGDHDMNSIVYVRRNAPSGQKQVWALAGAAAGPGGWVETSNEVIANGWAGQVMQSKGSIDVDFKDWDATAAQHKGVSRA